MREIEALRMLAAELIEKREPIVFLVGSGGSGKSFTALRFVETFGHEFGRVLRIDSSKANSGTVIESMYLAPTVGRPALLVIDNFESLGEAKAAAMFFSIHPEPLRNKTLQFLLISRSIPTGQLRKAPTLNLGDSAKESSLDAFTSGQAELDADEVGSVREFLRDFKQPGLLGPDGRPLREESEERRIVIDVAAEITERFIREIDRDPKRLYEISPRRFEELVAELFRRMKYSVELTPAGADGGKDLYVAQKDDVGSFPAHVLRSGWRVDSE